MYRNSEIRDLLTTWLEKKANIFMLSDFEAKRKKYGGTKNGAYQRKLDTEFGILNLTIPRLRKGGYLPYFIKPYQRQCENFINIIVSIIKECHYCYSQVIKILKDNYNTVYSDNFLRSLAKKYINDITEFRNKQFSKNYECLVLDGTYINLNGNKECVMFVLGIDNKKKKEILSMRINQTENLKDYRDMLDEVKSKGQDKVKVVISDGFVGIVNTIQSTYQNADYGMCYNHYIRSIMKRTSLFVSEEEKKHFIRDIKRVIDFSLDYNESKKEISKILKENEHLCRIFNINYSNIVSLIQFKKLNRCIWDATYTNNCIENVNKHFKRYFKNKGSFKNRKNLLLFISTFCLNYAKK